MNIRKEGLAARHIGPLEFHNLHPCAFKPHRTWPALRDDKSDTVGREDPSALYLHRAPGVHVNTFLAEKGQQTTGRGSTWGPLPAKNGFYSFK